MAYSFDDLKRAFENLGVRQGQTLYVASSLPFLREYEEPGKESVLEAHYRALTELVGPEGTIIVFTQSTDLCNTTTPYDRAHTPTISGMFSEYVRKKENSFRSAHPFCSFAAVGKDAKFITQDTSRHAYGPESPMARMIERDALALSVGLPPNFTFNMVHHIELLMGVPYRYTKEFTHPIVKDEGIVEEEFYLHVWYRECDLDRDRAEKIFRTYESKGTIGVESVGMGQIYSYSMRELHDHSIELFKNDIYTWVKSPPENRPYRS